ncbi:hypothetical protein SEA_MOSSROSE_62 [Gordonia phage MossRose]|nr:hypothetical protein SEA_MOSSROSE_62 [Gordonia phage MossRose]
MKQRLKVACAEEGMTYAEFIERALDARDQLKAAMRHSLDVRGLAAAGTPDGPWAAVAVQS